MLAFHLDHAYLPGGFVGVDVFFTISGYLIGQILLREVGQGTFSFGGVYQRRIARLVPTFAVVSLGTLAASLVIYSDQDAASTCFTWCTGRCSASSITTRSDRHSACGPPLSSRSRRR